MNGKVHGLAEDDDAVLGEFLRFLARDIQEHPERLQGFDPDFVKRVEALTTQVPVLQLLGADRSWPSLFDPKLVAMSAREFSLIGFERSDRAWVLQQWDCELI